HNDFVTDERVIWVEVEGVLCKWWSRNTFSRIASRWGNSVRQNDVHSEDPFGIYGVLNKKRDGKNIDDKHEDSLKYPAGFTPNEKGDVPVEKVDNWSDENRVNDGQEDRVCVGQHVHERVEVSNDTHESTCSGHFKKSEVPRKGGSILEMIDDLVNVGQTMGYDMTGSIKNMEEIIKSQGSESVGKSGGILCVWNPNMFQKINDTVSDYFIMVRADLDGVIDKGEGLDADGHRRREVVRLIQEVEKVDAMEVAQKAKIQWSIEGDENSKYYHGVLNKKRGRLNIRE
nr:RNA-directed DNA polymerase, eukaryota [Tanacetum cinerariifolium]GFB57340.1 RNA-directed DNA polymerase, eukaryota [Tanacetum cinerariifolium]